MIAIGLVPVLLLTYVIFLFVSPHPFLNGVPQFILASINALISSSQANYVNRLDDFIYRKVKTLPAPKREHVKKVWIVIVTAFFTLTAATLLSIARIIFSSGQQISTIYFSFLDTLIIVTTGHGYFLLAIVAWFSWVSPSTLKRFREE
ncbi:MAG: hypothetical protein AAB694_01740 [Patescibacteria group bacterium]